MYRLFQRAKALTGCVCSAAAMQVLAIFLRAPTCRLRYMSLRECGFSASSFGVLMAALGDNASVTELDVSSNPLASLGDGVADMVRNMLQSNCTLRRLVLSYTGGSQLPNA
jgi:hypothetical protein